MTQLKTLLKKNGFAFLVGLGSVALVSWLYLSSNETASAWVKHINNGAYDQLLRANIEKLPPFKQNNIAIIAIDDDSISEQGRWPWSREKLTALVTQLEQMHAAVIAFDIVFSEAEKNIMQQAMDELAKKNVAYTAELKMSLQQLMPQFNYDQQLAQALTHHDIVLGFVFDPENEVSSGLIPKPVAFVNKGQIQRLSIPKMKGYLANIPSLQKAAHQGGFINASLDEDGTLRESHLLMSYHDAIYPSLALETARLFLLSDSIRLITADYGTKTVLEGVQIDQTIIPTDETGKLLIPFRIGAYAFPYLSATDILNKRVKTSDIDGKIIFIGATATGMSDLRPSPVSVSYPGVEVHASITSAILDNYFPQKPVWGRGLEFLLIAVLGFLCALIFPFLNVLYLALIAVLSIVVWIYISNWLWVSHHLVINLLFPLATVLFLAFINMLNSYIRTSQQRKEIKSMFGQYVPKQHIDTILKSSSEHLLRGESKELTVLFSDIRGFTTLSEQLSASQLKTQLNEYLSAMTAVIFALGGTIDKYVGDMIMAFWNAPISDAYHAKNTVLAAFEMQETLHEVNKIFVEKDLPTIHIGIGVNTGTINVGDMGSKYRRAYTAIGDAVNLASRLESMCRAYDVDILVGENTYEETKDDFLYLIVDRVKVKGKNMSVNIYEPLGLHEECTREQAIEVAEHQKAVGHYFNQNWVVAYELFTQLHHAHPEKTLYSIYLDRIKIYRESPPEVGWDGAYIAHSK